MKILSSLLLTAAVSFAGVEPAPSDKSQFHLFHPTPRALMRDLSADRPDATESPYTVDAGHFQVEMSFVDWRRDREAGVEVTAHTIGATNLKAGLLDNVDIQFVFDAYTEETTRTGGARETLSGFSDLEVRLKVNLWGNDGGRTAFALLPFVKIPTGAELSNGHVEGGLILPFAFELSERVSLGLQAEIDFVHDDDTGDFEQEYSHTAVLGIGLTDAVGAYVEFIGVAGSKTGFAYQASVSSGFTYAMSRDVQFDIGTVVGLTDSAQDVSVFSGVTIRF